MSSSPPPPAAASSSTPPPPSSTPITETTAAPTELVQAPVATPTSSPSPPPPSAPPPAAASEAVPAAEPSPSSAADKSTSSSQQQQPSQGTEERQASEPVSAEVEPAKAEAPTSSVVAQSVAVAPEPTTSDGAGPDVSPNVARPADEPRRLTSGTPPPPSTADVALTENATPASDSTAAPPPAILAPTPTPAAAGPPPSNPSSSSTAAATSLAAPPSATPSRDASPSSTTSSARLAAGAPAPVKKFSALNVNKKFLETAIASAGKENKEVDKAAAAKGAPPTGPPDREKAAQKAAASAAEASKAEAEHQKAIIEELDSFRGSHLDPNAHHWDEPESDDDDFLDEVVDFGDGKKYTISASPQEPSFAADVLDQRARLVAAESAKSGGGSGGGARGEFDRSGGHLTSSSSGKQPPHLFNERSNRLEPKDAGGLPKGRRMSNDPAHRAAVASAPPPRQAWGIVRDANGKIVPSLPPSRALPPHLAAAAAAAAAAGPGPAAPGQPPTSSQAAAAPIGRASAVPSRAGGLGSVRPTGGLGEKRTSLSAPRGSAPPAGGALAKPTTSPRPAAAQPAAPPVGPAADRRPSHDGPRPVAPTAASVAPAAAVAVPPVVVEDISELQKDEMHTAAERARLRRQKEEEERAAAQERARQKAKELEARFGPAPAKSSATQAKSTPKEIVKKPQSSKAAPAVPTTSTSAPTSTGATQARPAKVLHAPQPTKTLAATAPVLPPPAPRQHQQQRAPLPPPQATLAAAPPTLKQLLEDGGAEGTSAQDVDFANLGDLLEADGSPQPAVAQPAASRRPAAADFFDRPPTGPVLPPPAPTRAESTSTWRRSPTADTAQVRLPAAAPESETVELASSLVETAASPDDRTGKVPQSAAVDNVLIRIKGAMHPSAPDAPSPPQVTLSEPEPPYTYLPRPSSPSPVWKRYNVKLNGDSRQRSTMPPKQLKPDPKRETLRAIDALSWNPSMYKWLSSSTLSRDDWLLAPPMRKVLGRFAPRPAPVVALPTKRISDLPVNPPPESPVFQRAVVKLPTAAVAAAPALAVTPPTPARAGQFARSAQEATWRRAPQVALVDPSAAVGGPVKPSSAAGAPSDSLFAAPQGPQTTGAPIIRLRTPPGGKSSSPRLPHGSVVGFYRDRTPSLGASSDEQMASLVRFTVSSELMDGPGGADAAYEEEDVPSFPSLMRPSSAVGAPSVASAQDEAIESNARSAATAAASALSPPSAATSDAWSKTPMAYSPADRSVLPGLYGGQPGAQSHSPWAAAPSFDVNSQFSSPKQSHHSPQYQSSHQQQQQQQQQPRGQFNPYAQQQQQRYSSPAMGFALPTSSHQPSSANGAIYSSTMNGNAPRFQPSGQQSQHASSRPDPSARPFVPQHSGGAQHHGLSRNPPQDVGTGGSPYAGASPSPISGSPYSPGLNLPGLPPAVQGGVWVPISMPMSARTESAYQSSPSLSASPLPTPYYTPQPSYQQQQQRPANNSLGAGQQPRFRNLSEFSTSSPVFTPQHQQQQSQQQQHGAFGAGGSPFEVRPNAAADVKDAVHHYQPSVRAPVFTPSGGAGGFGKPGPW